MAYKDKTWCVEKICADFETCPRALNTTVQNEIRELEVKTNSRVIISMCKMGCVVITTNNRGY